MSGLPYLFPQIPHYIAQLMVYGGFGGMTIVAIYHFFPNIFAFLKKSKETDLDFFNQLQALYVEGVKLAPDMIKYYSYIGNNKNEPWSQIELGDNWTNRVLNLLRAKYKPNDIFKFEHAVSEEPSGKVQAQVLILKELLSS